MPHNLFSKAELAELKKAVLQIFEQNPTRIYNHKQIQKHVEFLLPESMVTKIMNSEGKNLFLKATVAAMDELIAEEKLMQPDNYKYKLIHTASFIEGTIDIVSNGTGYVTYDKQKEDIYISPEKVGQAFNGDTVKISLDAQKPGKRLQGEVVEIVKRARMEFVGVLQVTDKSAFLVPDDNKMHVDIFIPHKLLNGAKDGEKAIAKITDWNADEKNPAGEIVQVLGMPGNNNVEMHAILIEYGFPLKFPESVERDAAKIDRTISQEEIKKRRDFRGTTTFTIDPVDAKDFDDALSISKLKNGNWEIGVHIADVSHYVHEQTQLDKEAVSRATSVYLVDRVIPMLPEVLSNDVCSLRPGEDKLCYSAVFEMNDNAEVLNEWFGRTVIHSNKRFAYEDAQLIIETGEGDLKEEILLFDKLAKILRKERFKKGAISFEKEEVKFNLDKAGNPTGVYIKESKDSNKLIEEFMLLANRKVAERIGKAKNKPEPDSKAKTFVYRIHDVPVTDRLQNFSVFAAGFGYKIKTGSDKEIAFSLNKLLEDVKGKKEQNVIEQLAIRTMAKAIYSTNNIGHYGLAFDYYTHFTSPIRRYPDVMVHRLLDYYLQGGKSVDKEVYEKQCKHSTDMEIQAAEAERASVKYKQVQYLQDKKDKVFDGIISGVTEWGIYIELAESKCEGMIRMRDLDDDFYEFDEKNYCIIGKRTRRKYQLGDSVNVVVKSTNLLRKQIDFLIYTPPGEKTISFKPSFDQNRGKKKYQGKKRRR